jgi:hypothetical protein
MGVVVKADPDNRSEMIRVEVPDADLAQDTPEQHAAKMAQPRALGVLERLATLETTVAALIARAVK